MNGVARCPAILIAGRRWAKASVGRDGFARPLETCFRLPCDDDSGMASRHVRGQRADDPQTEPANSHPPGLATTMRMAARPSSCLQRKPAAPFDLSAASSICGWAKRSNYCCSTVRSRIGCRRSRGRAFRCAPKLLQSTSRGRHRRPPMALIRACAADGGVRSRRTTQRSRPACNVIQAPSDGVWAQRCFAALEREDLRTIVTGVSLPNPASLSFHEKFGFRPLAMLHAVGRVDRFCDVAWG